MTHSPCYHFPLSSERPIQQAYEVGYQIYGDLGLDVKAFHQQLFAILQKHGQMAEPRTQILEFLNHLYVQDLYLTIACAQSSNRAWSRFNLLYKSYILQTAHHLCHHRTVADDVAESLIAHLYLGGTHGLPRIQSYDGRVALTTWLRAVIANKILDELELKHHRFDRLDELPELIERSDRKSLDDGVRTNRYGKMIADSLEKAFSTLAKSERLLLELIYVEDLRRREVADLLDTCKSNITYHLNKVRAKLKRGVIEALKQQYHLSEEAVRECLEELLDNPSYAVFTLIKTAG